MFRRLSEVYDSNVVIPLYTPVQQVQLTPLKPLNPLNPPNPLKQVQPTEEKQETTFETQKKWYFDNQHAKKQMLLNTCKSLMQNQHKQDIHIPEQDVRTITRNEDVRIYNRVANPVNFNIVTQGGNTIDLILKEKPQNIYNACDVHIKNDLYLQSMKKYDFYSDIPDTTIPPFDIMFIQNLFEKMGGKPTGSLYPSIHNISSYNQMTNVGEIKQYFNELNQNIKSTNYNIRHDAFIKFVGISPIKRAPYTQGIEVFWFSENKFIRRTIEKKIQSYGSMLQLTDIRAPSDVSVTFKVETNKEFFISINQPYNSDKTILKDRFVDKPGIYANIGKGISNSHSMYKKSIPNITKIYSESTAIITPLDEPNPFIDKNYSLTCEPRAPFLNFEVNDTFEETRNPGIFSQFIKLSSVDYHLRPEEREFVPGKKNFLRLNNSNSHIEIANILSWGTMTVAIRLKSIPVTNEIIINFNTYHIIATPLNRSVIGISIAYIKGKTWTTISTSYTLPINTWYLIVVSNTTTGFDIYCNSINELISNKGNTPVTRITDSVNTQIVNITIGRKSVTSSFSYDIAWVHFFDYNVSPNDIYRDSMTDWIFTE